MAERIALSPVKRDSTLTQQVYEMTRAWILEGTFPPGTRLKDNKLAEELGVSNTPVREAIRQLEREGLVEIASYKGGYVKEFTTHDVREIYDVRSALESLAVRLTVGSLTAGQARRMEELVERYQEAHEAGDRAAGLRADLELHDLIAEASGNATLQEMLRLLSAKIQMLRQMDRGTGRMRQSVLDHRKILDALNEGNGDRAVEVVERHIKRGKSHLLKIMGEA